MSKQNKQFKRAMSLLLSAAMTASMLPASVFAAEPVRIEDNSEIVQWTDKGWKIYAGQVHFRETPYNATAEEAFDTVTVPFTGTGIQVIGKKASNGNIMTASVDGGEAVDVDFYGDQGAGGEQLVWEVKGLEPGEHVLVLTNTNRHNEKAAPLPDAEGNYQPEINYFMVLDEEEPQQPEVDPDNFADGALHDAWEQDAQSVQGTGAVCAVENGRLHLKAGSGNGNSHAYNGGPAVFVDKTASEILAALPAESPKFFEFTVEAKCEKKDFRFGLFLDYAAPNNAAFVGADSGGWFWETHPGTWYGGGRQPAPNRGDKAVIRVEWTGKQITKATVNGTPMFATPVDISSVKNDKAGTVAFRVAGWGSTPADVLISDVSYTGQAVVKGYAVSGSVVDEAGKPMADASVSLGGKSATTDAEGKFSFVGEERFTNGDYTATITKDGYSTAEVAVKIADGDVVLEPVSLKELAGVAGTVKGAEDKPLAYAAVTVSNDKGFKKEAFADENGVFSMKGVPAGEYSVVAKGDFHYTSDKVALTVGEEGTAEVDLTLAPMKTAVLSTGAMDVTVSTDFPSVMKYDMKGDLAGKTMFGQTRFINQILVNGKQWVEVENVVATPEGENVMKYDIPVITTASGLDINAVIHAELRAEGNVLTFTITGVDYPRDDRLVNPLEQIYIYDQSMASVRSNQSGAKVATASLGSNTITSGDKFADVNADFNVAAFNNRAVRYAFVSTDALSAGVFSNSDVGNGGSAGSDNNRVMTTAADRGAYKNVGAGSNQWFYDRKISSADYKNAADVDDILTAEQKVVGIREGRDQAPYVKVVITGEQNSDGLINWQDAAIAARDQKVVHIPVHSDKVPEIVTTRIAMNFESEAPNPFLTTLDNVKRVALHSDGLGQSVLLKGYASEGHDSGHPDYYDIGERMGGVEDFKTMLHEGHKYGAQFGIHTNASEFYPEADAFNDNAVRWDGSRAKGAPKVHYGWNWLDQGIAMNGVYDLATDNRYNRYNKLHDLVGDNTDGGDGLDYIYVDVWGNNTSGSENAWHTRKLSNDITAGENNWRIVHEWAFANDWDSTFQHWVSDYGYGDYGHKGKLNSTIMRFMLNSHKDSWVPDFPSFGGAANAPLLGGPVMQGFEGWQSDYEYDLFIDTLYNEMLPTKFLQHYDIMKWVNNDEPVVLPFGSGANSMSWGNTSKWTPEVQIELRGQDNKADKVVVTRGSDDKVNETYTYDRNDAASRVEYRSRYITLNGRAVLVGASNPGDFRADLSVKGDMRYLLPWYWDKDGKVVSAADEKLYHYNVKGGETKWQLPEGWDDLADVIVYKLTDLGRTEETKVAVENGWVTLNAEAEIPYVVVKGAQGAKAPVVDWTAPGQHLSDVSFNSVLADHWAVTGSCEIAKTSHDTPMLKITGEGSVSQKLTDLKADEKYAVYVGVDNKSNEKASIQILDSKGNVVASEYTLKSFVPNAVGSYVHQTAGKDPSCFQNMYVFFTPKADETYTVVLSHEAGESYAYFDDVRVAERGILNVQKKGEAGAPGVVEIKDHYTYDEKGNFVKYEQDFEHVAQGLYPFVAYNGGQVTDCRMHLSKLHAPYTQAGWDTKKADDVLGGNWSIKINGQVGRNSLMYTTVPQNFHFEPGEFYTVEFDYQMGSEGTYEAVVLDGGVRNQNIVKRVSLDKSLGETAHAVMLVQGSASGQTAVGIWSTGRGAQVPSGAHADFGGYKDFMLDNLLIQKSKTEKKVLSDLIDSTVGMLQGDYEGDWAAFQTALTNAENVLNNLDATQDQVDKAAEDLAAAKSALRRYETHLTVTVKNAEGEVLKDAKIALEDGGKMPLNKVVTTDENGVAKFEYVSVSSYNLRVGANGYMATNVAVAAEQDKDTAVEVVLEKAAPATYVNDFNDGDVSMLVPLEPGYDDVVIKAVDGAAQVTFNNDGSLTVVDNLLKMKNGTYQVDIQSVDSDRSVGAAVLATDRNHRVFAGNYPVGGYYQYAYWNYCNGGAQTSYWLYNMPRMTLGAVRTYTVEVNEGHISLFVDGVHIYDTAKPIDKEREVANPITTPGYVGVTSQQNGESTYLIDEIRITSLDEGAAEALAVAKQIVALGEIKLESEAKVVEVRAAYEALADNAKELVGNLKVLTAAEAKLAELKEAAADQAAAAAVDAQITAIGQVTLESETKITEARAAYEALTETQKALVTKLDVLTAAEAKLAELKVDAANKAAAAAVDAQITAIGQVTLESEAKIVEARKAYDALTEAQKALVTKLDALKAAEAELDALKEQAAADKTAAAAVDAKIAAIGKVTLESESKITQSRKAYDALTEAQKALVTKLDTLKAAEAELDALKEQAAADKAAAAAVDAKIAAIGKVTLASEAKITQARKAYDALTETQKALVTKLDALKAAETELAALKQVEADKAAAAETEKLIDAIGEVTLDSENKIHAARTMYNNLTAEQQKLVKNLKTLTTAEAKYAEMKQDADNQAAAAAVDAKIAAIGEVTLKSEAKIAEARKAYEALTGVQKRLVKNLDVLKAAEDKLDALKNPVDYNDVSKDVWYYEGVRYTTNRGLFTGVGGNNFAPDEKVTRATMVQVLYSLAGKPAVEKNDKFSDVKDNDWFASAVAWAVEEGVTSGVGGDKFAPNVTIDREQMAAMLYAYMKKPAVSFELNFKDADQVSAWAVNAMKWAVKNGMMKGVGDNMLAPKATATRAEAAVIVAQFDKNMK